MSESTKVVPVCFEDPFICFHQIAQAKNSSLVQEEHCYVKVSSV